mmetsp:Transcript_22578/g.52589  ORF Transcript_22578/g.52589 Transcript_22578/m.52589 type:complete len:350 (+) Transcript_22578:80-1129(+)
MEFEDGTMSMPVTRTFIHFNESSFPGLQANKRSSSCPCRAAIAAESDDESHEDGDVGGAVAGSNFYQPTIPARRRQDKRSATTHFTANLGDQKLGSSDLSDASTVDCDQVDHVASDASSRSRTSNPQEVRIQVRIGCSGLQSPSNLRLANTETFVTDAVPSRKQQKKKKRLANMEEKLAMHDEAVIRSINLHALLSEEPPASQISPQARPVLQLTGRVTPMELASDKLNEMLANSPSKSRSSGKAKGKGLAHFERIAVGIEDDGDFRVVQRLIGPRGVHMRDIVARSGGAKVWIIGRGSRSWEDDVGPLTVCVGASSPGVFTTARRAVCDLLAQVHQERHMHINGLLQE